MSIKIEYEVRQDETNLVESEGSKEFETLEQYYAWLLRQSGHPFLHVNITKTEELATNPTEQGCDPF